MLIGGTEDVDKEFAAHSGNVTVARFRVPPPVLSLCPLREAHEAVRSRIGDRLRRNDTAHDESASASGAAGRKE